MKLKAILLFAAIFLFYNYLYSFEGLLFKPLAANPFEPRIGVMEQFDKHKLRLDIGTSLDLISLAQTEEGEIRCGCDFFTFTRLRSESNFKFPVETSDYFFGVNASSDYKLGGLNTAWRLRIAHISSHLVDGMANSGTFEQLPFVYSREFIDFNAAFSGSFSRFYFGMNYIFSTLPANVAKFNPQAGFDIDCDINDKLSFRGGYDFKLSGYNGIADAVNAAQAGLLFKTSNRAGILFSLHYYSGLSMHGLFYNKKESYFAAGFQVIFY